MNEKILYSLDVYRKKKKNIEKKLIENSKKNLKSKEIKKEISENIKWLAHAEVMIHFYMLIIEHKNMESIKYLSMPKPFTDAEQEIRKKFRIPKSIPLRWNY